MQEHVQHCKLAMDILTKEKLYLSKAKIRFLPDELKLLGRILDSTGIHMDPEKVDSVLAWKTPTNRDLLRGFISSVGYLADDIPNIRLPLGVLSAITGDKVPFRWTPTEQRAFDEAKSLIHSARGRSRRPLLYGEKAPPVWLITDGCLTGISGVVSQGPEWKTSSVAAFYSAKLNSAQRNYPVHEIEMLAGVETMLRHTDILQGVHFKWVTDHKGLLHLLNQKSMSGRQAWWLEKISSFMFEVVYVAGSENVLADALSRMYSNDSPGTEQARSEFTTYDIVDEDTVPLTSHMVLLAGMDAVVATHRDSGLAQDPGAETGRPETSCEFARRMKGRFVLRGPQDGTEGRNGSKQQPIEQQTAIKQRPVDHDRTISGSITEPNPPEPISVTEPSMDTSLVNMLENDAGIDLLNELRGQYREDPMFKSVLDRPKDFRNFEVKNDLVYLKLDGKNLLCIPKMMHHCHHQLWMPRTQTSGLLSETRSLSGLQNTFSKMIRHLLEKSITCLNFGRLP